MNSFKGPTKMQKNIHSFFYDDCYLRTTLIEAKMWFADPKGFNDPFDCNLPTHKIMSKQTLLKYLENQEPKLSNEQRLQRVHQVIEDSENQSPDCMNQIFLLGLGVRCFSRKDDNILMWAHYGKGHTGVCLTFDTTKDENFFNKELLAISYEKAFTDFDFIKYGSQVAEKELTEKMSHHFIGVKSKSWSYEEEIRLVKCVVTDISQIAIGNSKNYSSPKALFEGIKLIIEDRNKNNQFDRKIQFRKEALIEIKFGCNAAQSSIEDIRRIVYKNGYNTKLIKAKPNKNTFGLTFEEC